MALKVASWSQGGPKTVKYKVTDAPRNTAECSLKVTFVDAEERLNSDIVCSIVL